MTRRLAVLVAVVVLTGAPSGFDGARLAVNEGPGAYGAWLAWRFTPLVDTYSPGAADPTSELRDGDVSACARVLTLDDRGNTKGVTRFDQQTVTYRVSGPGASTEEIAAVADVLAWAATATGVTFSVVDGDADLLVNVTTDRHGGGAGTFRTTGGVTTSAEVTYQAGSPRLRWEEILGVLGLAGDWGPLLSTVSPTRYVTDATAFDAGCLHHLYRTLQPGMGPDATEAALRAAVTTGPS